MTSNYAPFYHDIDAPDHGRAFRVRTNPAAGANHIRIAGGRERINQTVTEHGAETLLGPLANGVNRVYISALGVITAAVVGAYPADSIPLARVTVAAGVITDIDDDRCFFYEDTGGGGGAPHALLSVTHPDTAPAAVVLGDLIAGLAGPLWTRIPIGAPGTVLTVVGGVPAWAAPVLGANTLDQAYDQGGAGAGRQINATDGAVLITNPQADAGIPNLELTRAPADIAAQPILGLRAVGDANFRFIFYGDGKAYWGSGAGAVDVLLERIGANILGLAVGDEFQTDTLGSRGGTQVSMPDGVSIPEFLGLPPTLIGIVGGTATPVRSHHSLSAQVGVADDLDNMAVGAAVDGDVCVIRPDTGDTITIRHAQGGAGQMLCIGNANIVLDDDHDFAICIYNSTLNAWMVLSDTGGGGGGGGFPNAADIWIQCPGA